jgi:hypothetical protein
VFWGTRRKLRRTRVVPPATGTIASLKFGTGAEMGTVETADDAVTVTVW